MTGVSEKTRFGFICVAAAITACAAASCRDQSSSAASANGASKAYAGTDDRSTPIGALRALEQAIEEGDESAILALIDAEGDAVGCGSATAIRCS